ncbi:unnamed protein product [Cyprideis torosa]|uniref:Uncharacterized protein n=1 Tax=Cyprideis torosa TaxID=163714 RepID=A0A7R8ZKU1_9CRUS|nr:unnamed protein product [Cyprideis torosa]CAG0885118.1 unnamed protein product [Cyprideis torosa]
MSEKISSSNFNSRSEESEVAGLQAEPLKDVNGSIDLLTLSFWVPVAVLLLSLLTIGGIFVYDYYQRRVGERSGDYNHILEVLDAGSDSNIHQVSYIVFDRASWETISLGTRDLQEAKTTTGDVRTTTADATATTWNKGTPPIRTRDQKKQKISDPNEDRNGFPFSWRSFQATTSATPQSISTDYFSAFETSDFDLISSKPPEARKSTDIVPHGTPNVVKEAKSLRDLKAPTLFEPTYWKLVDNLKATVAMFTDTTEDKDRDESEMLIVKPSFIWKSEESSISSGMLPQGDLTIGTLKGEAAPAMAFDCGGA